MADDLVHVRVQLAGKSAVSRRTLRLTAELTGEM
jgi:hypothetical protein